MGFWWKQIEVNGRFSKMDLGYAYSFKGLDPLMRAGEK